jgi:hypothetical protein
MEVSGSASGSKESTDMVRDDDDEEEETADEGETVATFASI